MTSRRRILAWIAGSATLPWLLGLAACAGTPGSGSTAAVTVETLPASSATTTTPSSATAVVTTVSQTGPATATTASAAASTPAAKPASFTYWCPFQTPEAQLAGKQVERFNTEQQANAIFDAIGPGNAATKVQTAIASGVPPDLVALHVEAYSWGPKGLLQPLDAFAQRDKWTSEGWSPAAWQSLHAEGKLWGTLQSLNVYAFHINLDAYKKASLDPAKPPTTADALDQMANVLTHSGGDGTLTELGFVPWQGTPTPQLFHWGWAFGGEFYDANTDKVLAATDERLLEALTWMVSYAKKYDANKIAAFLAQYKSGFTSESDPWYLGKLVTKVDGSWLRSWVPRYAKQLDYTIVKTPTANGVPPISLVAPAWMFNIPAGAKNAEGAWRLAKGFTSKQNAIEYSNLVGDVPPFADAAHDPAFQQALPFAQVFVELSETGGKVFPQMPVLDVYQQQLNAVVNDAIHLKVEPESGLANVAKIVQSKLDEFRAQTKK